MERTMIARHSPCSTVRRSQRGVALFVALMSMVVLSLGAVALIRSMETTNSVAGNIALRQGSMAPSTDAIERAADALFYSKTISNPGTANPPLNYSPALLAVSDLANGMPAILGGTYTTMSSAFSGAGHTMYADPAGYEVRFVIERVCTPGFSGTDQTGMIQNCDLLPPKLSNAKTTMKVLGPKIPPFPLYRVSIRVDDQNSNTVTFAQGMLR
jgi:Tfp pilus assembly protein PilX